MESNPANPPPIVRRSWRQLLLRVAWVALCIAYAILVAVATATHHARPAAWLLLGILALSVGQALFDRQRGGTLFSALSLAVVAVVFALNGPFAAIGLTTAIIQAFVSTLFFRGLGTGKTDLVTRMACAIRPERSARELAYTRHVAWCWAWLLAAMSVVSFVISFMPASVLWWWWMNGASYGVPIGFFIGEWLLRQWWLREDFRASGPIDWQRVRSIDYAQLFQP